MQEILQAIVRNAERLEEYRKKQMEYRRKLIRTEDLHRSRGDDKSRTWGFHFGEMLNFNHRNDKDNTSVRSSFNTAYHVLMQDAITACKLSAAKILVEQGWATEMTDQDIRTNNDEEVLEAMGETIDDIVFGERHGLLPSYEELMQNFPEEGLPLTHGIFVRAELYVTLEFETMNVDLWLGYTIGRYVKDPQSTDLSPVILETSIDPD